MTNSKISRVTTQKGANTFRTKQVGGARAQRSVTVSVSDRRGEEHDGSRNTFSLHALAACIMRHAAAARQEQGDSSRVHVGEYARPSQDLGTRHLVMPLSLFGSSRGRGFASRRAAKAACKQTASWCLSASLMLILDIYGHLKTHSDGNCIGRMVTPSLHGRLFPMHHDSSMASASPARPSTLHGV